MGYFDENGDTPPLKPTRLIQVIQGSGQCHAFDPSNWWFEITFPLSPYKKLWNPNLEKCVAFWDPIPILLVLAQASIQYGICTLHTQIIF